LEDQIAVSKTTDVVIIGGGVMGVSIAHHLAPTGSVILVEKRHIGAGASGKSGAIIRQHYSTELLVRMARHGVQTFCDFERAAGTSSGWDNVGCLFISSAADRTAAEGNVQLMRSAGAKAEVRTGLALNEVAPIAVFTDDEVGAWEPEAGYVDPALVLHGYAESAARQGVQVWTQTEVLDVELDRGKVTAVVTSAGRVETRTVVLCAGAWAGRLGARAGVELPLTVVRPQLTFFRRPGDFGAESHPVIADLVNGFYCRPDPVGRTLVGDLSTADDQVIIDPDNYDESISGDFIHHAREMASKRMPAMNRAFTRGGYSGMYVMTPDSHPILGEAPAVRGLYLAVGFSGHGFKLSPAVGRGLAELITTGAYQTLDFSPLRATRFAEGEPIRSAYEYGLLS
jgi:sarcosine oxidase, subunit beta